MALAKSKTPQSANENFLLFAACEQGDLLTLKDYLNSLSSSDIISIRDEQHATLFHYAARYGHMAILQYLIEHTHFDISQLRTEHGATCAHDAAVCDQVQILHFLFHQQSNKTMNGREDLSQKLRWSSRDEQGNTPLHLAAAYGSIKTLHYLLEHESADPHLRSYNGFQAIHYAASSGHTNCVKLLLNSAPDTVNEQTNTLLTPIYLACQYGSIETIKILSSHGANVKLRDENGLNCLHTACQNSHLDVVQWLVEKKQVTIDDVDYMNNNSLHYAAASGSEAILIYLLERNARIITSSNGNTPLHVAAENGQQGACGILIERAGCSATLRNSSQLTPIDLAHHFGFHSLAKELRLHDQPPLSSQIRSTNSNKIQLENATVVRLVVKKRHVERNDASNQVDEEDLSYDSYLNNGSTSSKQLTNSRFDLSELRSRVAAHEAVRRDTSMNGDPDTNVLMHSLDSLNQQNKNRRRSKLPTQTYAPWLKMGNITSEAFQQEIQKVGSNLRKVRRDSLTQDENSNSKFNNRQSRQSQSVGPPVVSSGRYQNVSSSSSGSEYSHNNQEKTSWKRTGYQTNATVAPVSKSHQFITSSSQLTTPSNKPEWQLELINRRQSSRVE